MDGRLACQTDETPDARALYAARIFVDCEDCQVGLATRGLAMAAPFEDDEPAEITSLARAGLALGQRADARAIAPAPIRTARDRVR
jgi:hypothetical protein